MDESHRILGAGLLDTLERIALQAGARIMQIYARGVTASLTGDGSPLTEADLAAEAIIVAGLAAAAPDIPVVSEEDGGGIGSRPDPEAVFLLVDPLDGTREFLGRNGEFTVNIALVAAGVPIAGVVLARDLVNEPAAVKTPTFIADVAKKLGKEAGISVEVWEPKRIAAENLAGLIAVARGSNEEPRFLRLRYEAKGATSATKRIALVGKGITFDSGGLSLKPAKSMETMKCDMAGAAAVLGTMIALGRLKLAVNVDAFIPISENLPGGKAQKPGDVIRFRNGKTVEVLNTDAEGRLVLADALTLAADLKPDAIIDLATLTGACMVALGTQVAGLFANDQKLADRLLAISAETGEPLWQLPLVAEYKDDIKSAVADLKNIGGGHAGSITAALFLQEFVGSTPWVHLDIAGPAFLEKGLPYCPKGGTGFGVRTLLRYLAAVASES